MADYSGVGSAGTMVATVLETVGYHFQAHVLDALAGPFQGSLGGLIYLVGIAVAVVTFAIQGSYKFGPWLLIGPPLFFATVIPRAEIGAAEWKFANQPREQEQVVKKSQKMMPTEGKTAKVSKLFARYNKIVSATIQETVRLFNQEKDQTDKYFIIKAQLASRVFAKRADDDGLHELITHALLGQCSRQVAAAKIIQDPGYPPDQKKTAKEVIDQFEKFSFAPVDSVAKYLVLANKEILGGYNASAAASPEQDAMTDLMTSLGPLPTTIEGVMEKNLTCKHIWEYAFLGMMKAAKRNILRIEDDIEFNKLDVVQVLTKIAEFLGLVSPQGNTAAQLEKAELIEKLARASAKYILRNEADRGGFAGRLQEVANMSREFHVVQAPLEPTLFETEFARGRAGEYAEKTRLMTTASNLPYYQGLLLYFLSIAFPFFAMLLLVPGKHAGFLMWFVLWLWVKSWDIGMAVVMQLDDMLFAIMNLGQLSIADDIHAQKLSSDFQVAMVAMRLSDPTFQMTTYYNIIAASLAAIPVVSSQLILGSLSGGAGIVSAGVKMMSDDLSSGAKKAQSQLAVSNMRHDMMELALARSSVYFQSRSGYQPISTSPNGRIQQEAGPRMSMDGYAEKVRENHSSFHVPMHTGFTPFENGGIVDRKPSISEYQDRAKGLKVLQGMLEGLRNPNNVGGVARRFFGGGIDTPYSKANRELAKALIGSQDSAGGVEAVVGALGKYYGDAAGWQLDPIAKRALFDAVYSDRGQKYAAMARIYEMLEVPWSMETSELADQDYERKFIRAEAEIDATVAESLGGTTAGLTNYFGALVTAKMGEVPTP